MNKMKFEELNLSNELLHAIKDMGFEEATPIQSQAIPMILTGCDVIGQSQTGTGKTAAFSIPLLEGLDVKSKAVEALILCPTRELAIQIAEEMGKLSKYKKGVKMIPVYGGQSIDRQIKSLKKGVNLVIGTPGRVMDHMRRGTLKLESLKTIILDEADEMLNMGFREDIETILKDTNEDRQTILFSATMAKQIMDLTKKFQHNPEIIKVVHKELTVKNIEQIYFEVKEKNKLEIMTRLIDMHNPKLALIFCNTKRKVDEVVTQLQTRGYFVDGLHGDMKQSQRDRVMEKFRRGTIEILVATDVAARGIDVDDVEVVFNYDIPQDEEYYVHRIGRTGRAGRTGKAFSFVAGREIYKLRDIQKYTKTKIRREDIPTLNDVEEVKSELVLDEIREVLKEGNIAKQRNILDDLLEDYASVDVAAALLKLYVGNNERENIKEESEVSFENTGAEEGMVRLFINIGRNHNIRPGDVVGAIAGETSIPGKLIGSIDIYDKYTFVEIPKEHAKKVLQTMKNNQIKGNKINIEPANGK